MSAAARIFEQMRQSEMNAWVGGLDPRTIGNACLQVLADYIAFDNDSRLLDFGCGIGRVLLSVLEFQPQVARICGFDIIPQVIRFCRENIASAFPRADFELVEGRNNHYDRFIHSAETRDAKSHEVLRQQYDAAFTGAYAFSVFTHVELEYLQPLLQFVSGLLAPGGTLLFTAFLLTPASRRSIRERRCWYPLGDVVSEAEGDILIANPDDRLSFIAFDEALVSQSVAAAGMTISHIEYGSWATASAYAARSMQDVIVCRRPDAGILSTLRTSR